jgi:hypothetical protein
MHLKDNLLNLKRISSFNLLNVKCRKRDEQLLYSNWVAGYYRLDDDDNDDELAFQQEN